MPSAISQVFSMILFVMLLMRFSNVDGVTEDAYKILERVSDFSIRPEEPSSDFDPSTTSMSDYTLMPNTYLVEFDQHARIANIEQFIIDTLTKTYGLPRSAIAMRTVISTSLFMGASFSVDAQIPLKSIRSIPHAITVYPVYSVAAPKYFKTYASSPVTTSQRSAPAIAHDMTGVDRVHEELKNFGKGVRVAVIDTGIDYTHPALGGCYGSGCKVAFGYDHVGDNYSSINPVPIPDSDPLDNCSSGAHGTHVAGIVAANASSIIQTGFVPIVPFVGVAPQATLGAYRIFGCNADTTGTDMITAAIYKAFDDKADIITMSVGGAGGYPESSDATAAQRVTAQGVYVTMSQGNDGAQGLQSGGSPAMSPGAMAVGSIDNSHVPQFYILTPDGDKIFYAPGSAFGGWQTVVNSTIVVNDLNATINDGCNNVTSTVRGAVALFLFNGADSCNSGFRCDKAAVAGATGCLIYNVGAIAGSSRIPSGSISLANGERIIEIIVQNPSALFTFTNRLELVPVATAGAPSSFTAFGPPGDLQFKPQISGIGGFVYSTVSSFSAGRQRLANAYAAYSGTSMACPYVAGTLALFLAQIGNPGPGTVNSTSTNSTRRPSFSEVLNLFQSTARAVNIFGRPMLATTMQQGAGLVDAFKALTANTIISPSELALNDSIRQKTSYTIKVSNVGQKTGWYNVFHREAALATGMQKGSDQLLPTPIYTNEHATVTIRPREFKLQPGESMMVTIKFKEPVTNQTELLPIFSGYIAVANYIDGKIAQVPYAGMIGNYETAKIIVRTNRLSFATGLYTSSGLPAISGQNINFTNSSTPLIVLTTAWASRIVFIDVVSGDASPENEPTTSFGLVEDGRGVGPLYFNNLPRNGASGGQAYRPYYLFPWTGHVSNPISNDGETRNTTRLLPGQYKLRFSALNHFGNPDNHYDYDVHYSPMFNVWYDSTTDSTTTTTESPTRTTEITTTTTKSPTTTTEIIIATTSSTTTTTTSATTTAETTTTTETTTITESTTTTETTTTTTTAETTTTTTTSETTTTTTTAESTTTAETTTTTTESAASTAESAALTTDSLN